MTTNSKKLLCKKVFAFRGHASGMCYYNIVEVKTGFVLCEDGSWNTKGFTQGAEMVFSENAIAEELSYWHHQLKNYYLDTATVTL